MDGDERHNYAQDEQWRHFIGGGPAHGRLRLLCVHGYGSNNDITRLQVANLRLREHGVDCDLLEATIPAPAQNEMLEMLSPGPFYSWFDWSFMQLALGRFGRSHSSATLHASLRRVMWYIAHHGPYDGLFGFSQGALLVSVLSSEQSWRGLFGLESCPWKFCICACAGGAHFLEGLQLAQAHGKPAPITTPVRVPALHLVGKFDLFHRRSSETLAASYYSADSSSIYVHAHGHELPMPLADDKKLQSRLREFLSRFGQLCAPPRVGAEAIMPAVNGYRPAGAQPYSSACDWM
eukprot:7382642-Prymnesium_polylepis.2